MLRQVRDIEYILLHSSIRRTTDIVIERDGKITVRAPLSFTPEQVDAVVESKRMWIYRSLAEWKVLNTLAVTREWVNGETFLYLGKAYRLALVSSQNEPLKLKNGRFTLNRNVIEQGGKTAAKEIFKLFYTDKAQQRLAERITHFAPKVGAEVSSVKIKDMGYRWASYGRKGVVNFNWKCLMAPPQVIDYLVVHELCHYHHTDHSDAFWNEVDKVLPDWKKQKEWLRKHGASLTI